MGAIQFEKVATDCGSYVRCGYSPAEILKHLQGLSSDGFLKTASVGGSTEQEFEQSFASLGYAYVKDKAPRLLDHMVGFQLVDRNEDSTKAMGVFGFNIGNQWLYSPVFFLNGDLKGHELLYIKKQDSFVPMKENWINYLVSRKPHVLGEGSSQDTFQLGGLQPDVARMTMSPSTFGKRGMDQWAQPFLAHLAAARLGTSRYLYAAATEGTKLAMDQVAASPLAAALAETAGQFDMNQVLPGSFPLLKTAFDLAQAYPKIQQGFQRFYGPDCFLRWANQLKEKAAAEAMNLLEADEPALKPKTDKPSSWLVEDKDELPEHPEKCGSLRVYFYGQTEKLAELDIADRERLLRESVLIKDARDEEAVSKAYTTQIERRLTNPAETGIHEVLERPGEFTRMLVLVHPYTNAGQQDFASVVRLSDGQSKAWMNAGTRALWADQTDHRDEFARWFQSLGDRSTLRTGGTYLAVGPGGSGTTPFKVREDFGEGAYEVDFLDHVSYEYRDPSPRSILGGSLSGDCCGDYVSTYRAKLVVGPEGRLGTKLRAIQGELRVPADYKFFQVKSPPPPKRERSEMELMPCCGDCERESSDPKPIEPGKLEDIQLLLFEKTARLKLYDDHSEVTLSTDWGQPQRLTKVAALVSLVREHGFREAVAREMLKAAAAKRGMIYRVRYAPGFGNAWHLVKQAYAPAIPPQEMGFEMLGNRRGVLTNSPEEHHLPVEQLDASLTDPSVYDPWQNYQAEDFQRSMQTAQQAAAEGQKEVFDTSMIGGLLKSVRQDSLVDRYLGDLLKSLDRLGRILFLFYWHQEEFEDRYGKQDLPELEDSIRNAFEAVGDVALFLKEKSVEPMYESSELDLEETARN